MIHKDTVIPDHSFSGVAVEEGQTRAPISKAEFAALLMLFTQVKRLLAIDVLGHRLYVRLEQQLLPRGAGKLVQPSGPLSDAMRSAGWLQLIDNHIFHKPGGLPNARVSNDATAAMQVSVYADKTGGHRNSIFSFFVNRSKSTFFINASCAPTQVLSGRNDLPLASSHQPAEKAEFLTTMFTLPFHILGQLLDRYVLKNSTRPVSMLTKAVQRGDISLTKIQLAAYTPPFPNKYERDLALSSLYAVYSSKKPRRAKPVFIPDALGFKLDESLTETLRDDNGNAYGLTGFMLRLKYGSRASYSLGMYAKDEVSRLKQIDAFAFADYGTRGMGLATDFTERSIRLDLNIHTEGLLLMPKQMNRHIDDLQLTEFSTVTAANVQRMLAQLLRRDPTLGIVFTFVLQQHLHFGQMFAVTLKQWQQAFDLLKERGLAELVDVLKQRCSMHRQTEQRGNQTVEVENSFTTLVKKHAGDRTVNPSRLRAEVMQATQVVKDGVVLRPGVDLQFPFRVAQDARLSMIDIYEDPDHRDYFYETGRVANDHQPVKVMLQARRNALQLYRHLMNGALRRIPTSGKVTL